MDNKIRDNGGDLRKYYIAIPNLVDDTPMSVYAFRLYVHLKRVAGDDGTCWQSTRTLAEQCGISLGKVSQAKIELKKLRLIKITKERNPKGGKSFDHITIMDIWPDNFKKYASSSGELASSPHEQASSPDEIKNNPIKNNPVKKEKEGAGKTRQRDPLLDHPAIMAYRDEAHLSVPVNWRQEVANVVDNPELWQSLIHEWIGRGWNKQNISGLLDAYKKGGIADRKNGYTPSEPAGYSGIREWLRDQEDE